MTWKVKTTLAQIKYTDAPVGAILDFGSWYYVKMPEVSQGNFYARRDLCPVRMDQESLVPEPNNTTATLHAARDATCHPVILKWEP